jgi:hypothetical protein
MICVIAVPGSSYYGFFVHEDADGKHFVRVGSEKVSAFPAAPIYPTNRRAKSKKCVNTKL